MASEANSRRTPLYDWHSKNGARLIDFSGWEMPVQYTGILEEHHAVRNAAGLFDISHMGQVRVGGTASESWLNTMLTNDIRQLSPGDAQYTLMLNETGGVLDDLIVFRMDDQNFLLVVNAGQTEADLKWLKKWQDDNTTIELLAERAGIALQGPRAEAILDKVFTEEIHFPKRNEIVTWPFQGRPVHIARTGYTGEDGFELLMEADTAPELWQTLLKNGKGLGLLPAGLGARDTLRLEAGLPLYGHELNPSVTPYEAGLAAFVNNDKPERFLGRDCLREQKQRGIPRKIAAFEITSPSAPPPRAQYPVFAAGKPAGVVTSGAVSPTLKKGIGLALLDAAHAANGTIIEIEIRGNRHPAITAPKPLYRRTP